MFWTLVKQRAKRHQRVRAELQEAKRTLIDVLHAGMLNLSDGE
jgi:hypothetical protein